MFRNANLVASRIGDVAAQSYALGYLGQLSERDQRREEALELTRKAVFAAQQANVPESLYRWHWQTGRLLRASGKDDEAVQAYRRAISTLQPIRFEFSTGYRGRRYSFRDSIGPVFFELADLLLKQASSQSDPKQREAVLIQARDTSELFKAAELQDYFKDECVKSARSRSGSQNELPSGTAIIYPVILPDRVELLLNTKDGWTSQATIVSVSRFNEEARAFRNQLQKRSSQDYLANGQQLYTWLIKPIEEQLKAAEVQTLVFVPDGVLRSIPMAALHDGKEFLVERYAIATTPGIDLTDFRPIDRSQVRMLALGLSEGVQGFPPLPNVKPEIEAVKGLYKGKALIDSQFRVPAVEREMQGQEYNVVHIASHGLVGNDARDSFLLAYDDKITMDRLSQMIGVYQFRKSALELLTLSACETAVGDDRAALGLAGVAVKSGARSALASLWFIDDEATSLLIAEFYRQLQNPSFTKAKALQQAQLRIASDPAHQHPSFWAPFLLINNWL
jgi:CHAT domain-containing protein